MKGLLNPRLVEEADLDRPPASIWERFFRFSLFFFIGAAAVALVCEVLGVADEFARILHLDGIGFAVLYIFAFLYSLTYGLFRFGKTRWVKIAWILLLLLVAAIVITFWIEASRKI